MISEVHVVHENAFGRKLGNGLDSAGEVDASHRLWIVNRYSIDDSWGIQFVTAYCTRIQITRVILSSPIIKRPL